MNAKRNFYFHTDCIRSTAKLITEMVEAAKEITWETFIYYVPVEEVKRVFPLYSYHGEKFNPNTGQLTAPRHLKDDYGVRFYSSRYDGRPCYFIEHSAIEHVFLQREN